MSGRDPSFRPLFGTFAALIGLLALTAGAASLPAGWWSTPIGLAIAVAKAWVVFIFFMRLRSQVALVRLFALVGFFFLAIMMVLTLADYFTRLLQV
jgi:cytochrome c oxidase subunit IV